MNNGEISVEQLARKILAHIKKTAHQHDEAHRLTNWNKCADEVFGTRSGPTITKFDEAWFLLVDKGFIRWFGGSSYDQNYMLMSKGEQTDFEKGVIDGPIKSVAEVERVIGQPLDPVLRTYFAEAVKAFQSDLLIASSICIGIVGERAARMLAGWLAEQPVQNAKKLGDTKLNAEDLIEECVEALEGLGKVDRRDELHVVKVALGTMGQIYRLTRNKHAHPIEMTVSPNSDDVATMLNALRRSYLPALYSVISKT